MRFTLLNKNILKLGFHVKTEATKYTTRNQVQIFWVIKCVEVSREALPTLLTHPINIASIDFCLHFLSQKTFVKLKSSQFPKQDPNLVAKS